MTDDDLLTALGKNAARRPPASAGLIARAETQLRRSLPPFLRRVYAEVADGRVGPAFGLYPLFYGGSDPGADDSLIGAFHKFTAAGWPSTLLVISEWGCGTWFCLDCRTDRGPVVTSPVARNEPFVDFGYDLRSWLEAGIDRRDLSAAMFEPDEVTIEIDPFTKAPIEFKEQGKPRGRPWS